MTPTELAVKKALLQQEFINRDRLYEAYCAGIKFTNGNASYVWDEVTKRLGVRGYADIRIELDKIEDQYPSKPTNL